MKANKLQCDLCSLIEHQVRFWKSSNDIDSPTHLSDMEDEVSELEILHNLPEGSLSEELDKLKDLYFLVRKH